MRWSSYGCTWEVSRHSRVDSYAFLVLSNLPRASITQRTHANHEPIVNFCIYIITWRRIDSFATLSPNMLLLNLPTFLFSWTVWILFWAFNFPCIFYLLFLYKFCLSESRQLSKMSWNISFETGGFYFGFILLHVSLCSSVLLFYQQAVTFIFKSLGMKCVTYLAQVLFSLHPSILAWQSLFFLSCHVFITKSKHNVFLSCLLDHAFISECYQNMWSII